jgi:uncharacterized membrane protein
VISRHFPWERARFWLRRTLRRVWVRVASFAVLAMASAILAYFLAPFLPADLALRVGADAVGQILGTLASSMLAVTTFSLSIAVSAFAAASSTATPRATALLQEDPTTQNVLATFLGAFLFSLLGLIGLRADLYTDSGEVILFLFTLVVVTLVVVALIRWIGHLTTFGRMADTLDRVERAAADAFERRMAHPWLGGNPMPETLPDGLRTLEAKSTGYVQHIDMQALQELAISLEAEIYLIAAPGSFVHASAPLLRVSVDRLTEDAEDRLRTAFSVGADRTFEEDPRFGLIVLTEIASRALSPAVNDPGTAISVIGRLVGILSRWREANHVDTTYDRLYLSPITAEDAIADAFRPIARDGAAMVEVQLRLQTGLRALSEEAPGALGEAARRASGTALERAAAAGLRTQELAEIRAVAIAVDSADGSP